jgi:hypothetical protein
MRVVLAAAAVAAAVASVPAGAAVGPVCHVRLVNAADGASSSCDSGIVGSTHDQTFWPTRVVTVQVATGEVVASLRCYDAFRDQTYAPVTVSQGQVTAFPNPDLDTCRLTLTASGPGTTATATSSPAKGFNPY